MPVKNAGSQLWSPVCNILHKMQRDEMQKSGSLIKKIIIVSNNLNINRGFAGTAGATKLVNTLNFN